MRAVPLDEIQGEMTEENSRKYIPKFTVDGYGKWREVKGEQNISSYNSQNFQDSSMLDAYRNLLHSGDIEPRPQYSRYNTSHSPPSTAAQNDTGSVSRATSSLDRSSTKESFRSYKNLSNSLRSNVFPGAGKDKWGSSTKTEFVSQSLPDSWAKPTANFGITKDSYMKWAEHDVYRQRLMKAWDKYVADAPNQKDKVHYGIGDGIIIFLSSLNAVSKLIYLKNVILNTIEFCLRKRAIYTKFVW